MKEKLEFISKQIAFCKGWNSVTEFPLPRESIIKDSCNNSNNCEECFCKGLTMAKEWEGLQIPENRMVN